jgi:hypothetical protein
MAMVGSQEAMGVAGKRSSEFIVRGVVLVCVSRREGGTFLKRVGLLLKQTV